jgi:hypothetical protein
MSSAVNCPHEMKHNQENTSLGVHHYSFMKRRNHCGEKKILANIKILNQQGMKTTNQWH